MSVIFARRVKIGKTLYINRRCQVACACHSVLIAFYHFVDAGNNNYAFRAEYHCRHAVAGTVDIYHHAVLAHGVGAHKIGIAGKRLAQKLQAFFLAFCGIAVNNIVALRAQSFQKTHFFQSHTAAPGYALLFVNQA